MDIIKGLPPGGTQDPYQIDHTERPGHGIPDLRLVANIGPHQSDLPHIAKRFDVGVQVWLAAYDAQPKPGLRQAADDLAPHEPGTAENRDEFA